jgi:hypothetical protein
MAARSKAFTVPWRSEKGMVGSNSSCMCICLCTVSSDVGIGIATGWCTHRRLMNDLEPKIRTTTITLTGLDAHDVTEHRNKQHNHVDTATKVGRYGI